MTILWTNIGNDEKHKNQGYLVAAENLVREIRNLGLEIDQHKIPESSEFYNLNIGHETIFNNEFVNKYDLSITNTLPDLYSVNKKYSIGFTYWETTRTPQHWIPDMNKMDEIWTTSEFIKNAFIDSGVTKPVYAFKLGINEVIFRKIDPVIKEKFIFIHDGSPSLRKNTQIVVDAFMALFSGNMNYHLIIKSVGPTNARLFVGGSIVGPIYQHPQITVVDENISDQQVFNLYSEANCMIYPTSGEGWGMIPFQSIAMGIPTICTNFSSCTEFADLSYPLDYKMSTENMHGIFQGAGEWAMPDFDDLCDKMLYIVNNYEIAKQKTAQGADFIQSNMKWSDVGKEYYDRLCQILKK